MGEIRKKLTTKQFEIYIKTRDRAVASAQVAQTDQRELSGYAELILDAHGVDGQGQVTIDEATRELVVQTPGTPDVTPVAEVTGIERVATTN